MRRDVTRSREALDASFCEGCLAAAGERATDGRVLASPTLAPRRRLTPVPEGGARSAPSELAIAR